MTEDYITEPDTPPMSQGSATAAGPVAPHAGHLYVEEGINWGPDLYIFAPGVLGQSPSGAAGD